MMWPSPFHPYEGGPTVIEWLKQVCDKFNELLAAVKNVRELPAGGSHGQVPTPREDGAGYEWVDQSGGGGGGGTSDLLWKPTVSSTGIISWARSSSTTAPASQNIKGPQGLIGPVGPQGPKGPDGPKGDTGPVGPAGPRGATGPQGPKGTDGAVGPQGPEGPAGPKGDTGPVGPQGPKGSDGATGPAGPAGPEGPEGPAGPKGDTGPVGPQGPKGSDGATGPAGPAGPEGPAGPKGADGATPTFEVGTVSKLAPDAEPTVTLENVGGDLYMMDFGIPQGQPGTPGGGGGGGDVTAAGNNVFTGQNQFEGLTVLGETHVPTPNDNNDATNKLYVDTLVANTKTSTVEEVNAHTDERVNALRVLPAGGTSGQVPTIASDGATVEWKTPDTGGGGSGGGGIEWIPVALEKQGVALQSTLSLFYDKADNTHLKLIGDYHFGSGRVTQASFNLPVDNPLNYSETVYASVPTTAIFQNRPYESQCLNYLLIIDGRNFMFQKSSNYNTDYNYIVGCEFYVIKNVTPYSPGLPGPTTPTDPTYPGPTEGPMNEHTEVE